MHGQYKSIKTCPKCHRFSVTFDPFSVISLPIPQETGSFLSFYYVPYDLSKKTTRYTTVAKKADTIKSFREQLAKLLGIHKDSFILAMVSANTFDTIYMHG